MILNKVLDNQERQKLSKGTIEKEISKLTFDEMNCALLSFKYTVHKPKGRRYD